MRKKISESIQAKTFISMVALLAVCCVFIYATVMIFLPKNYHARLENQASSDFCGLVELLEKSGWEENSEKLLKFSMKNNASLTIRSEKGEEIFSVNYADMEDVRASSETAASMSYVSSFWQDGKSFEIFAVVSLTEVSQSQDILLKLIPFIAAIILAISVTGALICSRYYSRPLIHICQVAKRMSSLDLTWKCEVKRKDEIGVLSESLNTMSRQLGNALESLKTANERLRQDIEREREQEKQRIDFFTAVSHELKTPVTIMKGELEGMICQVGEYRNRDRYLRHCLKTVNEMEKTVKEILMAARMGGSDFRLRTEDLDISSMLEKSCRKIKGRLEDRQMELFLSIDPDFHYQGDGRLLEKVFSNVVGNAAEYSPCGAGIRVSLKEGMFSVENTGVHLAEEDLKKIFMPFYRVDKSRSRNSGGSGLGLYIVSVILEHHGIYYGMENTEKGVRFTADFRSNKKR
ncbi:MAG TPA: HAMP domain-containing histidine kinase [Candidatus Blautia faecipullorum]|nr:HAMP domain-containing histidine kinase [Candidatus Blautia faecipullorum]